MNSHLWRWAGFLLVFSGFLATILQLSLAFVQFLTLSGGGSLLVSGSLSLLSLWYFRKNLRKINKNLRKNLALSGAHPISCLFRRILVPLGSFPILTFWHRFSLVADSPRRLSVAVFRKNLRKINKIPRKSSFSLATCGTSWLSGDVIFPPSFL